MKSKELSKDDIKAIGYDWKMIGSDMRTAFGVRTNILARTINEEQEKMFEELKDRVAKIVKD